MSSAGSPPSTTTAWTACCVSWRQTKGPGGPPVGFAVEEDASAGREERMSGHDDTAGGSDAELRVAAEDRSAAGSRGRPDPPPPACRLPAGDVPGVGGPLHRLAPAGSGAPR